MRLHGKVAVVTGASRGIGKSTAILFAREGAKVVVNYKEDESKAKEVVYAIGSGGGKAMAVKADIANPADVHLLFQAAVQSFGTVDVVVNNAGVMRPVPFLDLQKSDMQLAMDTNAIGTVLCSQAAARIMIGQRSGKIVNVASVAGLDGLGTPGNLPYAASKAAVISLTRVLAKALAPFVQVNAVAPGFVNTGMGHSPEYIDRVTNVPLRRILQPDEIASVCLFLASGESSSLTGEVIVADAGFQLTQGS